jgi:hypothetical protein
VFQGDAGAVCGRLYEALLPEVTAWLDDHERTRPLWEEEDAHLDESLRAIAGGVITVDEDPAHDLAVVTVPAAWAARRVHRFTRVETGAVHPMAVNQTTSCLSVLVAQGGRYRLEMRYEGWVMLVSRRVRSRPDLRPLADELTSLEPGRVRWRADAPGALTPVLEPADGAASEIALDVVRARIAHHLATAPPAWDPFLPRP